MHHRHVHVQIVRLLEAFAADHTGKLQVCLRLVLGHVILERGPLPALEAAHLAPETHTDAVRASSETRRCTERLGSYSLQWFGSGVTHLMHRQMLPLLERLAALITDVVPHLWNRKTLALYITAAIIIYNSMCFYS